MTLSMTGFARVESSGPWGRLSWELRSVNHRYLDLQFRMPEELRGLEPELRQTAAAKISRGKVECGVKYSREGAVEEPIEIDEARVKQLRSVLDRLSEHLVMGTPSPLDVLSYPGVVRRTSAEPQPLLDAGRALFEELLTAFNQARLAEGRRMAAFLEERCDTVERLSEQVRARFPVIREGWLARLRARALELGASLDAERVEQELVVALQRMDVEEELSRLASHVEEIRQVLRRKEPVGRRLDFLIQELNREANTLSSKSQDSEMTRCAVEMKVLVEQMREQVQNIE